LCGYHLPRAPRPAALARAAPLARAVQAQPPGSDGRQGGFNVPPGALERGLSSVGRVVGGVRGRRPRRGLGRSPKRGGRVAVASLATDAARGAGRSRRTGPHEKLYPALKCPAARGRRGRGLSTRGGGTVRRRTPPKSRGGFSPTTSAGTVIVRSVKPALHQRRAQGRRTFPPERFVGATSGGVGAGWAAQAARGGVSPGGRRANASDGRGAIGGRQLCAS